MIYNRKFVIFEKLKKGKTVHTHPYWYVLYGFSEHIN